MVATVLMVGDHIDTVRLVRMALEFSSYELLVTKTLEEGLSLARQLKLDLLMIEGHVFDVLGREVLADEPAFHLVPQIHFRESGSEMAELPVNTTEKLRRILFKPFTPLQLHHVMESALKMPKASQTDQINASYFD